MYLVTTCLGFRNQQVGLWYVDGHLLWHPEQPRDQWRNPPLTLSHTGPPVIRFTTRLGWARLRLATGTTSLGRPCDTLQRTLFCDVVLGATSRFKELSYRSWSISCLITRPCAIASMSIPGLGDKRSWCIRISIVATELCAPEKCCISTVNCENV